MATARKIEVHITFSDTVREDNRQTCSIEVASDGKDSIWDVKSRIATAVGGAVTPDNIFLYFGPNNKKIGRQFEGDPNVDDKALTLAKFSVLPWLERFQSWHLGAKMMPPAPPPPGVAIKKAAALAEGKDADKAVQEARQKGELLKLSQLPPPWGPKPYKPSPEVATTYQPPAFPASSAPGITV